MSNKKSKKEKKPTGTKKQIRKSAGARFLALGHTLGRWIHSPAGKAHEALASCRICGGSVQVNLQSGETVSSKSRCFTAMRVEY